MNIFSYLAGPSRVKAPACLLIILSGLALIAGLWISVLIKNTNDEQIELNNIIKQNGNLVQAFEEHTVRTLEEIDHVSMVIADSYARNGQHFDLAKLLEDGVISRNLVSRVILATADGGVALSDGPVIKSNIADRDYFTAHAGTGFHRLYIGLPVQDRVTNTWTIPMSRRISNADGSFGGVVVFNINPSYFSAFYEKINLGPEGVIALVGRDGIVRSRLPAKDFSTGSDISRGTVFQAIRKAPQGFFIANALADQRRRIFSYRALHEYPFIVVVSVPEAQALAAVTQRKHTSYLEATMTSAVLVFLTALLILFVLRRQRQRDFSRAVIDSLPGLFFLFDTQNKLLLWNRNVETTLEYSASELSRMSAPDLVLDEDRHIAQQHAREIVQQGRAETELTLVSKSGKQRPYLLSGEHISLDRKNYIIGNGVDISIRRQAAEAVRQSELRFRSLTEMSSDWYWEQDEAYRFTLMSTGIDSAGFSSQSFIGKTRWEIPHAVLLDTDWETHRAVLDAREPFYDVIIRRQDIHGNPIYTSTSGQPVFDENKNFCGYRGIGRDITERKKSEERILYLAHYDELTCLPNRSTFSQRGTHALTQAQRYKKLLAVLFIDLDRFKIINDTLGHEIGDSLLKDVAQRLRTRLRAGDVVARQGGDEFIVLIEEYVKPQYVAEVARKVLMAVAEPFVIEGHELNLTASIGISTYPNDGDSMPTLLKNADIALYRAKEEGKNIFQFYSVEMNTHSYERLELESNLRHALERGEMLLHYQPKVDILTGRITGLEALLRWNHPKFGMVSPLKVIPLAEETGLIGIIGEWVLKTACAQNKVWQRAGLPPIRVAVNLSARQFSNENLLQQVADVLKETGLDPVFLELEITESMVMHNPEQAVRILNELQAMRIHVSIDDFGTGYSSLAYLKRFPIDTLKIDRSFISDIPHDAEDVAITQAIIAMAHSLRLRVIAEGVETEEQLSFLRANGCDEIQGYYFSKPLPENKIVSLLLKHARSHLVPAESGEVAESV